MKVDRVTKRWMRNASDEKAVRNGCRFDEERGQEVVDWIEDYCVLYEGEHAGEPMRCVDWQYDFVMRLFGWVKWSDDWHRMVRRFKKASVWIPKKNKKSPTLAALGLYLLCGDGEQGQKVYFGAKDGQQAREIAGKHAAEMMLSSAELSADCTLNKSLLQITHNSTRSILKPISSSDSKAQKAKEGLNGSVLIDETHVVDEAFMGRISRAGISRSEPLIIEVSTAGDDPEGYGYKSYEKGKRVESGEETDEELLFVCYEAPQDLTDGDLARDPIKYGKMANPAWGHTIKESEFLADYNRSKHTPTEFARFKMYRLNIWQRVVMAWLKTSDWKKNKRGFGVDDLRGRLCFGGLDLSKTIDMTAFVLSFPWDDGSVRLRPYFWMPEDVVRESQHSYLRDWAEMVDGDGEPFLRTTPGNVCNYDQIESEIAAIKDRFDVRGFCYDPWNAEQFTQRLEEHHGLPRVKFDQNMRNYAGPTTEFERLCVGGLLHHDGNPILSWQAGHTKVLTDKTNGNKRPVKPKHGDPKKIDGIIAAVMSISLLQADPDFGPSVYDDPDERPDGLLIIGGKR